MGIQTDLILSKSWLYSRNEKKKNNSDDTIGGTYQKYERRRSFLDKELAYITSIISKMIENKREKKKMKRKMVICVSHSSRFIVKTRSTVTRT